MQIKFTPNKIREAKAYLESLKQFSKDGEKRRKKSRNGKKSFFDRFKRFIFN